MLRPARIVTTATFLFASLALGGCKTLYTETYSPRRNHFKPLPVKHEAVPPPIETPVDGSGVGGANPPAPGAPPPAPSTPDALGLPPGL